MRVWDDSAVMSSAFVACHTNRPIFPKQTRAIPDMMFSLSYLSGSHPASTSPSWRSSCSMPLILSFRMQMCA